MLEITNLETVYHSVIRVLRGISLSVPAGGVVALLGPNGAGKTTTLRAITGLLDIHNGIITKGDVTFEGESLRGLDPPDIARRGIAQVMEGRRVFAELSVEENLLAGAWVQGHGGRGHGGRGHRGQVRADLARMYERFDILAQRRHRPAGYLSGGEQQMLAIARALMARPRLLLMDEPSLGLAPKIVLQVAALIREIRAAGTAILLVEQNASMALELADHATILETGRVVLDGPSEELRADRDIQEFYLGLGEAEGQSFRDVKHYRRRKRWLS